MLESVLPIALAFVSLGAFELGSRVREHIHVVMPYRDPVTIMFFLIALSPVISKYLFDFIIVEPADIWYIAFVVSFLSCYSLAYLRGDLDMVYVNVHTIVSERFPSGALDIKPVVYYWDRNGNQCCQEQTLKEIFKTVFLGIRSPLRLDIGIVKRTTPVFVQKILYPKVSLEAIDVIEEKITETVVRKFFIPFRVRSYSYTPAPSCIMNVMQWLTTSQNQKELIADYSRLEAQLLETKLSSQSQFYGRSADLLVEMVNDRTVGAEVYNDVMDRLSPKEGEDDTQSK